MKYLVTNGSSVTKGGGFENYQYRQNVRDFYKSKPKGDLKRFIKTLRKDRNTTNKGYIDKYLRESVVVSVYTRNIGAQ